MDFEAELEKLCKKHGIKQAITASQSMGSQELIALWMELARVLSISLSLTTIKDGDSGNLFDNDA